MGPICLQQKHIAISCLRQMCVKRAADSCSKRTDLVMRNRRCRKWQGWCPRDKLLMPQSLVCEEIATVNKAPSYYYHKLRKYIYYYRSSYEVIEVFILRLIRSQKAVYCKITASPVGDTEGWNSRTIKDNFRLDQIEKNYQELDSIYLSPQSSSGRDRHCPTEQLQKPRFSQVVTAEPSSSPGTGPGTMGMIYRHA